MHNRTEADLKTPTLKPLRPSKLLLGGLFVGTCALMGLLARPDGAQNLPAAKNRTRKSAVIVAAADRNNASKADANAPDVERRGIDFYTKGVRDSLFSAPQPPKPKAAPAPITKIVKAKPAPPIPPIIVNPFADWTYSGTITMGDEKMALLENRTSKEGQYVRQGETFMGAEIISVTDQMVTLKTLKQPYMLAKSDTINVTPLDKSAAYLTGASQQGQPGQNGQPNAGQPAVQTPATGAEKTIVLPNGRVLTGDRAARYQQRMDSRFNGGGQGGGGRRGRGGNGGGNGGNGGNAAPGN